MIQCNLCKKEFKQLDAHLRKTHNITSKQYKELFPGAKIMSPEDNPMFGKNRSGEKGPNFGKRFSEEHKEKISKTRIEKGIAKGENNPMFGKKHRPESIEKNSQKACERIIDGRYHKAFIKGYFHSNKSNKDIWYDSSYELRALQMLEDDIDVIEINRNKQKIPYEFNGKNKNCLPDFLIKYSSGMQKVIEIKPQRKINNIEKERIKVETMYNYYKNSNCPFELWTEEKLFKEGN